MEHAVAAFGALSMTATGRGPLGGRGRSTEAAAIAGVVYAVLSLAALVALWQVPDLDRPDGELTAWFVDRGHQASLILALNAASMSSVAFLWFIAVIRRRLGDREDQFFSTVFFGSGIVHIVVMLVATAAIAAPAVAVSLLGAAEVDAQSISLATGFGSALLLVVAPRIQAVFVFTTSTVVLRSGVLPAWLAWLSYAVGAVMFVVPFITAPFGVAFPLWALIVSIVILVHVPGGRVGGHDQISSDD